jgi:hypothetical protein
MPRCSFFCFRSGKKTIRFVCLRERGSLIIISIRIFSRNKKRDTAAVTVLNNSISCENIRMLQQLEFVCLVQRILDFFVAWTKPNGAILSAVVVNGNKAEYIPRRVGVVSTYHK